MKKSNLFKAGAIIFIMLSVLFKVSDLKAQNDILDLCPFAQGKDDCSTTPNIEIPFNFDGMGNELIIHIYSQNRVKVMNVK